MSMSAPRPERETSREQEAAWFAMHGITRDLLEEVVQFAHLHRQNCQASVPNGYPGYVFWGQGNAMLRDMMTARGWRIDDTGGQPRTVSPDGTHAITFASGDENVGNAHKDPSTRHPRGEMTEGFVNANRQFLLFAPPPPASKVKVPKCATYILFARRFRNELRFELSLPIEITDSKITRCEPRFFYDPIILPGAGATDGDDDADGEVQFDVPRK